MTESARESTTHRSESPDSPYEHTSADVAPELFDGFTESR
jgi:hypothetical protein